jgi:predicted transcriptional regulator
MYVDILEALANAGPLKLTQVMRNANVECNMLRDCIDFLTAQGLVEVRTVAKERKVYAITQLGVTVLKQFRDLKEVRPIIVETANNVKKRETYPF